MTKHRWQFLILLTALTGCTDTIDSVTREYRNATNEALDAMAVVTSDERAEAMITRVFKPLSNRYEAIDKRLENVKNNRTRKDFVKEVFESDGTCLYLTEVAVNRQRFALEKSRLDNLIQQLVEKERAKKIEEGEANPVINEKNLCPNLSTLVNHPMYIKAVQMQLTQVKLQQVLTEIDNWMAKEKDYPDRKAKFLEKCKAFGAEKIFKLDR